MRKSVGLLFALALILVGCSKEETEDQIPKMLNVELQIEPKAAEVNQFVTFQAKITYGDEVVTDADDVSFEIWREGQQVTETFEVAHSKDGIYQYEKKFADEGTYYVYAHVTARSMHTMPKEKFEISTPTSIDK